MNKDQSKPVLTAEEIYRKNLGIRGELFVPNDITPNEIISFMEECASQLEKQRGGLYEEKVYSLIVNLAKEISSFDFLTDDEILLIKKVTKSICQLSPKSIDEEQLTQLADKWVIAYESKEQELEFKEEFKNDVRQLSPKEDALRKEVEELKAENERLKEVVERQLEELHSRGNVIEKNNITINRMALRMVEIAKDDELKSHTLTADKIAEAFLSEDDIDKEAHINAADAGLNGKENIAFRRGFKIASLQIKRYAIERLSGMIPAKEESKWISVEERLPELRGYYSVILDTGKKDNDWYTKEGGFRSFDNITKWQEII